MEMNFREALDGAHTVSCSEEQVPNIQTFQPSQKCLETGETTKFLEYGCVTFFRNIIIIIIVIIVIIVIIITFQAWDYGASLYNYLNSVQTTGSWEIITFIIVSS